MIFKAKRYDVKGRKYIGSPVKYYYSDIGLRNVRLNFRQTEDGVNKKTNLEVNFVANLGSKKYYIQSALTDGDEEKRKQEVRPYSRIADSFKKIVVVKDNIIPWHDENGILYIGIEQFLLEENAMDI